MTIHQAREMAMQLDEVIELPHFEKTSFRVRKKIFLTIDEKLKRGCLLLNNVDQDVFTRIDPQHMYPVPNKWGLKGATFIDLSKVNKALFKDALVCAYCKAAPKTLAEKHNKENNYP